MEEEKSSILAICVLLRKLNLSPDVQSSILRQFSPLFFPSLPPPPTKYYVMMSFFGIDEGYVQQSHICHYLPVLRSKFKYMNMTIKGPFSTLYQPDNHCLLISVDSKFKDAINAEICQSEYRRATPITKEQFDANDVPDIPTIPNYYPKYFSIRVSATEFPIDERERVLSEFKRNQQKEILSPKKIVGPFVHNGELVLVIQHKSYWWATHYFHGVFKYSTKLTATLLETNNKL